MKDLFEIIKSKIAGNGVFACEKIKNGRTIFLLSGEFCTIEEMIKRCNEGVEEPSDPLGVEEEEYLDLDEVSEHLITRAIQILLLEAKTSLLL